MLKRFFWAALCSIVLIDGVQAQEVIVAREKKSGHPKRTPEPSEQVAPESSTPAPRKSKSREKKSAPSKLTLEEMRAAGARAAGGSNESPGPQSPKTREANVESVPMTNPAVAETPRSVKRESPVEQRSSHRPSKGRGTNVEGVGPIRPTMIESGREAPSPSPSR